MLNNTCDARRICRLLYVIFTKYAYHNDKKIAYKMCIKVGRCVEHRWIYLGYTLMI